MLKIKYYYYFPFNKNIHFSKENSKEFLVTVTNDSVKFFPTSTPIFLYPNTEPQLTQT